MLQAFMSAANATDDAIAGLRISIQSARPTESGGYLNNVKVQTDRPAPDAISMLCQLHAVAPTARSANKRRVLISF